jgi:orotidine-5'-phosphate decarboxylase
MDYLQSTHPDIFTICDAKRGDIANTNKQYAKAYFELFGFDAITLHPYMGKESLMPFFEYREKVSIILCHTSNPGAKEFQEKQVEGNPFWQVIVQKVVEEWNDYSNCMLFMGATYPEELKKARELARNITFLVAGVDTQGGKAKEVIEAGLDVNKRGLIVNSSRGIIFSENPGQTARQLRDEINLWRTQ